MLQAEQLKIREGKTPLSGGELTKRFLMLDQRLHALELLKVSWEEAVTEVNNYGLSKINDLVHPLIDDVKADLDLLKADWAALDATIGGIDGRILSLESRADALEASLALYPTALAGHAGKVPQVKGDESGLEFVKVSSTMPKSFYLKGALITGTDLVKYLAGATGNITEIAAKLASGTEAVVVVKNAGDTMATLTVTPAGVKETTINNAAVTWSSEITIGITSVTGDPVDLIGYFMVTPT
jgi:hypothetical protein